MNSDSLVKIVLRIVIGFGVFFCIIAIIILFTGDWVAFFGIAIIGAGFAGLGWAGQRILLPALGEESPRGTGTVAGVVFGGAGGVMLIGSVALLISGELGGFAGLAIFGLNFCSVGYAGYRLFNEPKGKKQILVNQKQQQISGFYGQSGQRTSKTYRYVDASLSDEEIERMQQEWSEKPWTQREDWAAGYAVQMHPQSLRLLTGFTIVWNIIGWLSLLTWPSLITYTRPK